MKIKNLLIILILIFQGISLLHAEDIYVSSSEELIVACNNASSGDVIYISSGTYNGPFVVSNKSNLTLTSYNGEVVIEGSGSISLIEIYNSSGITINNLILRNNIGNDSEGIKIHGSGDGIIITNCEIYNIGWTSDKTTMPTSSNSAHAIVMVGSESGSIKNVFIGGNYVHDCITGYSESITMVGNIKYFLIEGNTLENNTNIGIVAAGNYTWTGAPDSVNYARSGIIRKNTVSNYAGPADLAAAAGIYADGGCYITIENNIVTNYKVGFSLGCEIANKSVYGNVVRNNLAYNCSFSGLYLGSNTTSMVYNAEVYNNTFYKCGTGTYDNGQIALLNNSGSIIKNNILYPEDWRYAIVQMYGTNSSELSELYNLYWRDNGNTDYFFYNVTDTSNAVLADPLFVNIEENDFHISEYSPAVNAGDPDFDVSGLEDLDGNARIINSRVDIGAYEVVSIAIDGSFSDWDNLSAIEENNGIVLKAFSNDSCVFLAAIGRLNDSYQFYLDVNNDNSTKYIDGSWSTSGADYLVENGVLYSYDGSGWSWTPVETLTAFHDSNLTELSIPLSALNGLADTINFGYKDLQSWTAVNVVPVSGSALASYTLSKAIKATIENYLENFTVNNQTEFNLYPNPVKDILNITSNKIFKDVQILNISGQEVIRYQCNSDNMSLNTINLNPGLYLCKVWFDNSNFISRKFLIKR